MAQIAESKTKVTPQKKEVITASKDPWTTPPTSKLPTKFRENYIDWLVLERIGNYVFLEGQSVTKGRKIYDVQLVRRDQDGNEFVKSAMNWDNMIDPGRKLGDPIPSQFIKEKKYEEFLLNISDNEKSIQREIRKAEAEVQQRIATHLQLKKVKELRELQSHLQTELREMNLASETISGVLKNTRGKVILNELQAIECYLKYGFPML